MQLPSPRKRISTVILTGFLVGLLGCVGARPAFAGMFAPEAGGSPNADSIAWLYKFLLVLGAIVFLGVEGSLLWFLYKYRARKGAVAAQIRGNTQLELAWTIGAACILIVITVVTFVKLDDIINPIPSKIDANGNPIASSVRFASGSEPKIPKGPNLRIRVNGQQYMWRYQYPGSRAVFGYEEMVVPVGMTVLLDITSDDVVHSWWVPALGGKFDAVPGNVNHTWFQATKAGVWKGQCAELCGRNHANMTATVRAVPFAEYREWYNRRANEIQAARNLAAAQRKLIDAATAAAGKK